METSLKDLGIQNQAMSFQEMVNNSREKRAQVIQPPPPPTIPQAPSPVIMPEPIPMPMQSRPQPPMPPSMAPVPPMTGMAPQAAPMLPFAEQVNSNEPASKKCDAKPKGGFCMDSYQKEILVLAAIASALASPLAQDKLADISYFRDNRVLRAIASGAAVAILFAVVKKFML